MQFKKVLITILPTKISTLCQGAQRQAEFPDTQRYTEQ
jgi:hypothetical protein